MSQGSKPFAYMTAATLQSLFDAPPHHPESVGKWYLSGRVVIHHFFKPGLEVTTTPLVSVDIAKGWFETENTIWVLIAEANEESYKMTNPS